MKGCVRQRIQLAWGFEPHPDRRDVNDLHRVHDKRNSELPFLSRGSGLAVEGGPHAMKQETESMTLKMGVVRYI